MTSISGGNKLELLTNPDMLLMVEKDIRGGIFHSAKRYAKVSNKYMKGNDDPRTEMLHLMYWNVSNLYE